MKQGWKCINAGDGSWDLTKGKVYYCNERGILSRMTELRAIAQAPTTPMPSSIPVETSPNW